MFFNHLFMAKSFPMRRALNFHSMSCLARTEVEYGGDNKNADSTHNVTDDMVKHYFQAFQSLVSTVNKKI